VQQMNQSNSDLCRPGGGSDDGGLQYGYMTYAASSVILTVAIMMFAAFGNFDILFFMINLLEAHSMATALHLAWATDKKPKKEHVSFPNFVRKFDITDRKTASEAFSSLISSIHLRQTRRNKLQAAYKTFRERHEDTFWERRALTVADKRLVTTSATIAKETAVIAQKASIKETVSGFKRYRADLKATEDSDDEIIDDSDTESERAAEMSPAHELDDTAAADVDSPPETKIVTQSWMKATPFYDLIAYVFLKVKDESATLPSPASSALNELSINHREIYKAARDYLQQPGPVEAKKDAMVLLSGIINTVSPNARQFSLSNQIMNESRLPVLDPQSEIHKAVTDLLAELLKALCPDLDEDPYCDPDFVSLQKKVWQLLQDAANSKHTRAEKARYTTLQIVQQILLWIELGLFAPPTSEHVYVSAWAMVFNILFFDTSIRAIPGELVSKASTSARQLVEDEFGATTSTACGRKVDLSIRIQVNNEWKSEIAIFEFKASTSSGNICEKQQKKSVRLNAAILLELEACGLDLQHSYPIIAEGKGLGLDFYTLRRYDDVLGAGRSTVKGISLPPQVSQLKSFLQSSSILTLLSFREHLRKYAMDTVDVLATSSSTPFGGGNEGDILPTPDDRLSTPDPEPPSTPTKRSNPFILFTPSKKYKAHHVDEDEG
ncbi:hypothetical protein BGX34_004508, partial [Mortierella sp. NVP85]